MFLNGSSKMTKANNSTNINNTNNSNPLILQAPNLNNVLFFNEIGSLTNNSFIQAYLSSPTTSPSSNDSTNTNQEAKNKNETIKSPTPIIVKNNNRNKNQQPNRVKKRVTFPEDGKIIKDCSEPPRRGWIPGMYSTSDLVDSYLKSCEHHKCKPLNKLLPQLRALQDIDCSNGEKVNVLNLKSERLDSRQCESLEEIFKRLSFKTIDLDASHFDDETSSATLFEILDYYDTCERLILANNRSINFMGWQSLSKYIRKTNSLENLELRGILIQELVYFTHLARSIRLSCSLRVLHLENSNIQGRFLIMLAVALKDNTMIKEIYLGDNKIQPDDGQSISKIIKENKYLELLDLKNNNLQDIGLSHICSGLSEQINPNFGLKSLFIPNNSITSNGITVYLSKALIHNRSLISLNISQNSLTNEAIYDLKEALIVNKQITSLILSKIKLSDEGVIALAEYIAETQSLRRLDLRENDIRLGGLMALASSIKFNKTINRLDLDREPKKENSIRDSAETARRLIQDIQDYCMRNKRAQTEKEAELKEMMLKQEEERRKLEEENERKLFEILNEEIVENENGDTNNGDLELKEDEELIDKDEIKIEGEYEVKNDEKQPEEEEEADLDVIHHNELLKKLLNNKTQSTYLLFPMNEEFQFIETDLNNLLINKKENQVEKDDESENLDNNYDKTTNEQLNHDELEFEEDKNNKNTSIVSTNEILIKEEIEDTTGLNSFENSATADDSKLKLTDNQIINQSENEPLINNNNKNDNFDQDLLNLIQSLVDNVVNSIELNNCLLTQSDPNSIKYELNKEEIIQNNIGLEIENENISDISINTNVNENDNDNNESSGISVILNNNNSSSTALENNRLSFSNESNNSNSNLNDEDDSDIEVLTVSNNANKNRGESKIQISRQNGDNTNRNIITNKEKNLLDSINEESNKNELSFDITDGEMTNFELLFDESLLNSKKNNNSEHHYHSTPYKSNKNKPKNSLVDYSLNSTEEDSSNNNNNSKSNEVDDENSSSIIVASSSPPDNTELNNNNQNKPPYFASKLTNSQLSEELSNEIGFV